MTKDEIDKLIVENEKLAYLIANRYRNSLSEIIDYEDIKSICILGLVKAANSFNKEKGIAFSTYACTVIKNELLCVVRTEKKILRQVSLDAKIDEVEELTLMETIVSTVNLEDTCITNMNIKLLDKYINELPKRLQIIIEYNLKGYTQMQISEILNISQPQVSRLFDKAINILRYKFNKGE